MSLLVEEEVAVLSDAAVSKDRPAEPAVTTAGEEEVADFITRHVLEKGASFFDG